jgi:hypothetical protein
MLQQQYLDQQRKAAFDAAQMPMLNQVIAAGGNLGANLGTNLGRMFGGRTAAEVENEAIKGVFAEAAQKSSDPAERLQIAADGFRQRGMEGRAIALEQEAAKMGASRATAMKATTEMETEQNRIRNATRFVQSRIPDLSTEEAEAIAVDKEAVRKLVGGAKPIKVEADGRVRLVNAETGETIKDLGAATDRRPVTSVSVDARAATGVAKLVSDFESTVKTNREAVANAQTAQNLINESIGSRNSQAWEQARTLVAKATGKGRLSNEDIRRTGVDPRLIQGVADWLNKKTVGVPNEDIQRQLFVVARALERDAAQEIDRVANRMRAVGAAENLDPDKLDIYFPGVERTEAPQGAVNWSDLQ